jgi:hypothetical protein
MPQKTLKNGHSPLVPFRQLPISFNLCKQQSKHQEREENPTLLGYVF